MVNYSLHLSTTVIETLHSEWIWGHIDFIARVNYFYYVGSVKLEHNANHPKSSIIMCEKSKSVLPNQKHTSYYTQSNS